MHIDLRPAPLHLLGSKYSPAFASKQLITKPSLDLDEAASYTLTHNDLDKALQLGLLTPSLIQSACEFGAGKGGSTQAILNALPALQHITAIEFDAQKAQCLRQQLINSSAHVVSGDGISFLKRQQAPTFDLIMSAWLDPRVDSAQFLQASLKRLKPGGKLFVTSDVYTMSKLWRVLKQQKFATNLNTQHADLTIDAQSLSALARSAPKSHSAMWFKAESPYCVIITP